VRNLKRVSAMELPAMVIVANKRDITSSQRCVYPDEAFSIAQLWGVPYIETSAKQNLNVTEAFEILVLSTLLKETEE